MRKQTKTIFVGGVAVGGGAPVSVQSMANTPTEDVRATLAQIRVLAAAGCDFVRLAVPTMEAAAAFGEIRKASPVPLVADVHFDYRLALKAVAQGADKVRVNPGNIGGPERVRAVADACREKGVPIRIGVNGGSLEKDVEAQYGHGPEAMVHSALHHVQLLEDAGFSDICVSLKSSDVPTTVAAYRLLSEQIDYPLHLGITETGTEYMGLVKSAAGIGALLLDGIGDTIRVSLTADPVREAEAGVAILKALGLRGGPRLISCPTCGRTRIDLIPLAQAVEARLKDVHRDITVAVMGCAVNGPGEARHADYGVAGGKGEGVLFKRGEIVGKCPADRLCDALMDLIQSDSTE